MNEIPKELLPKQVGEKIRALREAKKITQSAFARQLGISPAALYKIEAGQTDISISRLAQIAGLLHITPDQLLTSNANAPSALETAYAAMKKRVDNREEEISLLQTKLARLYEEVERKQSYFYRFE
ncbi:hypothetical protein BC343_25725 [Mucilaginibacter pedocola]|uniref:HTH cro/C1-type domain-containing protein n=2 Tax=Mucilaginibacter pedocola TaxID=1792845 RepID=A0A1S9PHL2_9SPHI|nr:hypothetical protein BC343_25725 [Mucilaginibacter pedocola]